MTTLWRPVESSAEPAPMAGIIPRCTAGGNSLPREHDRLSEGIGREEGVRPVPHQGLMHDDPVRVTDQLVGVCTEA